MSLRNAANIADKDEWTLVGELGFYIVPRENKSHLQVIALSDIMYLSPTPTPQNSNIQTPHINDYPSPEL